MDAEAGRQEVEPVLKQRKQRGEDPRDERQERAQGEPEIAADHADGSSTFRSSMLEERVSVG